MVIWLFDAKQIYDTKVGARLWAKVYAGYNLKKDFASWISVSQFGNIYLC